MVRYKLRKTKQHTESEVQKALKMLIGGKSFRKVQQATGIPIGSLHHYKAKHHQKKKILVSKRGRPTTLTCKMENRLVTVLKTAALLGWPLDRNDVAGVVSNVCSSLAIKNTFKDGMPGRDFISSFLKRHKSEISLRKAEVLKVKRAEAEDPAIISDFIDLVENAYTIAKIDKNDLNDAKRVFNLDETGFQTKGRVKNVIVPRGGNAQTLAPTEGKANFSVLVCGNAAGTYLPPYVVYKGSNDSIPCGWLMSGPKDAAYTTTKNGWMNSEKFEMFIPWFDQKITEAGIKKPVVAFMDGYSSHLSLTCVQQASDRQIILVKLPPNSTHILQALDVSVFGPAKKRWEVIVRDWYRQTKQQSITKPIFPVLLGKLFKYLEENNMNLVNGFAATSIWPVNKERLLEKVEKRGVYKTVSTLTPAKDAAVGEAKSPEKPATKEPVLHTDSVQVGLIDEQINSEIEPKTLSMKNYVKRKTNQRSGNSEMIIVTGVTKTSANSLKTPDPVTPRRKAEPERIEILSPASKAIANAVQDTLTPPQDVLTKKGLDNMKNTLKLKKRAGEIVTSKDAIAAMKAKADLLKAKEELKLQKEVLRRAKKEELEKKKKEKLEAKNKRSASNPKGRKNTVVKRKRGAQKTMVCDSDSIPKKKRKNVDFTGKSVMTELLQHDGSSSSSTSDICKNLPTSESDHEADIVLTKTNTVSHGSASDISEDDDWKAMLTTERRQSICKKIYSSSSSDEMILTAFESGDFVLVKYIIGKGKSSYKSGLKLYVAQVKETAPGFVVDFMRFKEKKGDKILFEWPDNSDECVVDADQVLKKVAFEPPITDLSYRKPCTQFSKALFHVDNLSADEVTEILKKSR